MDHTVCVHGAMRCHRRPHGNRQLRSFRLSRIFRFFRKLRIFRALRAQSQRAHRPRGRQHHGPRLSSGRQHRQPPHALPFHRLCAPHAADAAPQYPDASHARYATHTPRPAPLPLRARLPLRLPPRPPHRRQGGGAERHHARHPHCRRPLSGPLHPLHLHPQPLHRPHPLALPPPHARLLPLCPAHAPHGERPPHCRHHHSAAPLQCPAGQRRGRYRRAAPPSGWG